jgi:hypothetical protein
LKPTAPQSEYACRYVPDVGGSLTRPVWSVSTTKKLRTHSPMAVIVTKVHSVVVT